jgi:hypothetical protein
MDVVTVLVWTAGILAVAVIAVALMVRKSRKRPVDPEENLRLLLGPRGMAARDRNRAAAQEKWDTELSESRKERKPMSRIGILFDIDELGGGLYGYVSYKIFFGALDTSQLLGCSFYDGDTDDTLRGGARHCCISVEFQDPSQIAAVKNALSKSTAKGLLPPSLRLLGDARVRLEPLVFAGRISSTGELTDCETSWVMKAWEETRGD